MSRPKRSSKEKKNEISWSKNPEWTEMLVAILTENESIRNGLFHDPREKKNPSGHSKEYWYMRISEGIFKDLIGNWNDENMEDLRKDYASSVGNYLGRLKSEYKERIHRLKETGGNSF